MITTPTRPPHQHDHHNQQQSRPQHQPNNHQQQQQRHESLQADLERGSLSQELQSRGEALAAVAQEGVHGWQRMSEHNKKQLQTNTGCGSIGENLNLHEHASTASRSSLTRGKQTPTQRAEARSRETNKHQHSEQKLAHERRTARSQ